MGNERFSKLKIKSNAPLRAVARIQKVFGVKGEVKILSYSREIGEYEKISDLLRGKDDRNVVLCEIEKVEGRGNDIFLKFKGCDDRTDAEKIVGEYLFVEEQKRKRLPKGKYFDDEILDCTIVSEKGKVLGVVHDVVQYPTYKVYEVKTPRGIVIVPVVDEFIRSVDIIKKEIVVRPPEGLFDGTMAE
jgi:16S rRNA processing protein RimM